MDDLSTRVAEHVRSLPYRAAAVISASVYRFMKGLEHGETDRAKTGTNEGTGRASDQDQRGLGLAASGSGRPDLRRAERLAVIRSFINEADALINRIPPELRDDFRKGRDGILTALMGMIDDDRRY